MRIFGHISLFVLLLASVEARGEIPEIRDLIEDADFQGMFMGMVRVTRGDEVLLEFSRGLDRSGQPVNADTPFWVGSISKHFAAAAVLRLVEEGRVSLDDEVRVLLGLPDVALRRDGVACTLDMLLSHRCGLPGELPMSERRSTDALRDLETRVALLDAVGSMELESTPGEEYSYSNVGYSLAGLVVLDLAGEAYPSALSRHLWEPLGLQNTGTDPGQTSTLAERIAPGHADIPFMAVSSERWLGIPWDAPGAVGAAGNAYSTARELDQWFRALMGGEVLAPNSLEEMLTARLDEYGLGLIIEEENYGQHIWHNGALSPHGYNSFVGHVVETDTTVVVLANRGRERVSATRIGHELIDAMHGERTRPLIDSDWILSAVAGISGGVFVFGSLFAPIWCLALSGGPGRKGRLGWSVSVATAGWFLLFVQDALELFRPTGSYRIIALALVMVGFTLAAGLRRQKHLPDIVPERRFITRMSAAVGVALPVAMSAYFGNSFWVGAPFLLAVGAVVLDKHLRQRSHSAPGTPPA